MDTKKDQMYSRLTKKLSEKTARIGIVGLGYVGLPLARVSVKGGYSVLGYDNSEEKIETLRAGSSPIKTFSDHWVQKTTSEGTFSPSGDPSHLRDADIILICVPTPLRDDRIPDTSYIESAADTIQQQLKPGQMVILESTTYPGTTRELVKPTLEQSGHRAGEDFYLAYSPEREDPGNRDYPMENIPKVVGGIDDSSLQLATRFYQNTIVSVSQVDSTEEAEATKLMENIFRAVNIALVNEMKQVLSEMDINVWNVINAAATKPFGFMPFYPGPGVGGHCIPKDLYYLMWKAEQEGLDTNLLDVAGEINRSMPKDIVRQIVNTLEERNLSVHESNGLLLGVAYKPDVDDIRESPGLRIFQQLEEEGVSMDYHDPYVPSVTHPSDMSRNISSVSAYPEVMSEYDFIMIATDHSMYEAPILLQHARLIFDSRNLIENRGTAPDRVIPV